MVIWIFREESIQISLRQQKPLINVDKLRLYLNNNLEQLLTKNYERQKETYGKNKGNRIHATKFMMGKKQQTPCAFWQFLLIYAGVISDIFSSMLTF